MDGLVAKFTEDGVQLVKDELYANISKFNLVDEDDEIYYTEDIHSLFFDENGILTATVVIPKEDNFAVFNRKINLTTNTDVVMCTIETAPIQFLRGIGGIQEVKITVSGEPSTVVFKNSDFTTNTEFEIFKSQFDNYLTKEELTQAMEEFYEKCLTTDDVGTKVLAPDGDATNLTNLPSIGAGMFEDNLFGGDQ